MTYNPATDFMALWRNTGDAVSKVELPGLDYVVAALARAGFINLVVSATAPVVSQNVTAWLQAAVPSYSAEGVLHLWNPVTSAYAAATPALFFKMVQAATGQNGVSWWTSEGGAPTNTVGNDGDFAVRLDAPNGMYGPKIAGAWPTTPIPGTADVLTSTALDNTFGTAEGQIIYRAAAEWDTLAISAANRLMLSDGTKPEWGLLSDLLDAIFGTARGSLLYRDVATWEALPPGIANQVLATGGPDANPAWSARTPEFDSGTVMLFQQSTAPVGWTKQVAITDYALRVTSGAVTAVAGTPFSSVFAQTAVGSTTITQATSPSHVHSYLQGGIGNGGGYGNGGAFGYFQSTTNFSTGSIGGDQSHTHSIALSLSYIDVIIASKN